MSLGKIVCLMKCAYSCSSIGERNAISEKKLKTTMPLKMNSA